MSGLGFGNPWLLLGLLAAGLPVAIHLLTRARPRKVPFPPFRFLTEACAGQESLHRLRAIVILAVRTLCVLALVLLFARPFLKPVGSPGTGSAASARVVILVDASMSMGAVRDGVSLFSRAQSTAGELLRRMDPAAEADVVLVGATPRALLPTLSRNIPALHEELGRCVVSREFGDAPAALALGAKLLNGVGTIYILSDFQRSNWDAVKELPRGIQCRPRPVSERTVENMAITGIRLAPANPMPGERVEVLCSVLNASPKPRQGSVRLELGDISGEKSVEVPPYGTREAAFSVSFAGPGIFAGKAVLAPDDLAADDVRYVVVNVRPSLQILLVSDSEPADRRSAAFFVSRALAPLDHASTGYHIVRRHSQDTDRGILETTDAYVLVAPASLSGEATEIVGRRVSEGARLVSILDGPTAPGLATAAFSPPFRLVREVTLEGGKPLTAGARRLFPDGDAADWAPLRFRRHYLTELLAGRKDDVVLYHEDGSVALTLGASGQGAAVFANMALTPDGSNLAGSPMFPAMVQELFHALRQGGDEVVVTPGAPWTVDVVTHGDAPLVATGPLGGAVDTRAISRGRTTRLAMPVASEPGVYRVSQSGALVGAGAVNVDARESDTRPMALNVLTSTPSIVGGASISSADDETELAGAMRPLWPELAAVSALLLALEMFLLGLWRRGPRKAGGPP